MDWTKHWDAAQEYMNESSKGTDVSRESEIQLKMQQKLEEARKHRECAPGNCYVGSPDECPHQAVTDPKSGQRVDPKTGQPVTTKQEPDHALPCPECGGGLDTLEVSYGRGVTDNGIWVTEGGHMHAAVGFTDPMDYGVKTVGAICPDCNWKIERPDWFEYLKDYEANEVKRIREEFLAVKEGREPEEPTTGHWQVPLNHGQIQIVIPVPGGDPIEMTLDMNEMDGPQDIHVDPDKGAVSIVTDEPFEEIIE